MKRLSVIATALVVFAAADQRTIGAQDFYKDKTLTIVVGYSPGGSFDLYARVLARYIGRYLPGNPTRVVENMTGAGGMIAANHLYNRVKPDGLTIGAWASPLVLQHIMGNEAAQFDGRKFGYLGTPSPYDTVCTFNQQSGITKMDDWINAKRPQKISTIGPGTSTSDIPKLLKAALHLPIDVIDGYKGGADVHPSPRTCPYLVRAIRGLGCSTCDRSRSECRTLVQSSGRRTPRAARFDGTGVRRKDRLA